ncbi:hypothetical protein CALCODRAFT_44005 [Calocera cornea HHB12733]|uniref:Uncharacterized protein n=1 Tax=Calocera cornea HHB12733 TaxID=1353952 RepID=A0A165DVV2_9BASI|nr:hypothetical protein CALCODRAFT_44005 [Calocera cornea HHB12733]
MSKLCVKDFRILVDHLSTTSRLEELGELPELHIHVPALLHTLHQQLPRPERIPPLPRPLLAPRLPQHPFHLLPHPLHAPLNRAPLLPAAERPPPSPSSAHLEQLEPGVQGPADPERVHRLVAPQRPEDHRQALAERFERGVAPSVREHPPQRRVGEDRLLRRPGDDGAPPRGLDALQQRAGEERVQRVRRGHAEDEGHWLGQREQEVDQRLQVLPRDRGRVDRTEGDEQPALRAVLL